jgi:hypothetical protein
MLMGGMNPVLQFIRKLAELRLLIGIEVVMEFHLELAETQVAKLIDLLPVRLI